MDALSEKEKDVSVLVKRLWNAAERIEHASTRVRVTPVCPFCRPTETDVAADALVAGSCTSEHVEKIVRFTASLPALSRLDEGTNWIVPQAPLFVNDDGVIAVAPADTDMAVTPTALEVEAEQHVV